MNPKPSLAQCLVLHDIADDGVWLDLMSDRWHGQYKRGDVTTQVQILLRDGYVIEEQERLGVTRLRLTAAGAQVLQRRPWAEVVEKVNGPG